MDSPIRVAHIMGKMVGGGVEAVVMNYYRHINRSQVQFDFLVDADSTLVPKDEIESLGGRVFVIPPYQHQLAYQRELTHLFKQQGWQIVHSHINALSVFPLRAAKKSGIPIRIAHSHATMGKGEAGRNIMKIILRLFSNLYPTNRVACSEYAGKWLFGKNASITVIPNAVEMEKFRFDPSIRSAVRCSWGVGEACCVVGNVGRLERTKNHSFLIDVFKHLHTSHNDSMLVIVGCGSLREILEQKVNSLGLGENVLFLGQSDNVGPLYQGMDVFVLPSLYEGFGMALLEAQVSGVPCLGSNRVTSEAVLSDGCRLIGLEEGADAWAQVIWSKFTDSSRAVGFRETLDSFDIKKASERLGIFYLELLGDF